LAAIEHRPLAAVFLGASEYNGSRSTKIPSAAPQTLDDVRLERVASLFSPRCHVSECVYCFDLLELQGAIFAISPSCDGARNFRHCLDEPRATCFDLARALQMRKSCSPNALGAVLRGSDGSR
jgi:hypothetical protein